MKSYKTILTMGTLLLLISVGAFAGENSMYITKDTIKNVSAELLSLHGENAADRINSGIRRVANLWMEKDGTQDEFAKFCKENFLPEGEKLDKLFDRLQRNFEILFGGMLKINLDLKKPIDLAWGEPLNIDWVFAEYSPGAHVREDLYNNKVAFVVALNFPRYTLAEKEKLGQKWNRKEWAFARMGDYFTSRVPSRITQEVNKIMTRADNYISTYNIYLGNLINEKGEKYFPEDLKLITHWGLRDELKARYNDKDGLKKQKMIFDVMERIITQDIPKVMIDKNDYLWNPETNELFTKEMKKVEVNREPDTRYATLLSTFKAAKMLDKYNPDLQNHIRRKFESDREIPEKDVEDMFVELVSSDTVRKAGKLISKRLGRELKPWDIWYRGFRGGADVSIEKLDKIISEKYPTDKAFEKDLSNILRKLDFTEEQIEFLAPKVSVEASRGVGHAWGSETREANALLRTRVPKSGMTYKGYNIAVHELGHCIEQTLTLHKVDYYAMHGIPNTALTEAFAYVFQSRDIEMLGLAQEDENSKHMKALASLWNAYEIMGVALVDMNVWRWMYKNPDATPAELKAAVISIAKDIWNKYYADVFGTKDEIILAVYSHMIDSWLYLPDYPIGHLVEYQIHRYMEGKKIGPEMERMCSAGLLTPQHWMVNAVGSKISPKPLLAAAEEALKHIK